MWKQIKTFFQLCTDALLLLRSEKAAAKPSYRFAFLVHPRNIEDVRNKYPLIRIVPRRLIELCLLLLPPFTVGTIRGTVVDSITGKEKFIDGDLISIPMTGRQMMHRRHLAERRVQQALKICHHKGVKLVGLGALTSVVTNGGTTIADNKYAIHITNGNALTAGMALKGIMEAVQSQGVVLSNSVVSVIGATGSIGHALVHLLLQVGPIGRLHLVGRTVTNLEILQDEVDQYHNTVADVATSLDVLKESDVIIMATSSPEALIRSDMLKPHALVLDISQPRNVSRHVLIERPDVTVVDGGVVALPKSVYMSVNLGTPEGTTFACLSETMLLAVDEYASDFTIGRVTIDKVVHSLKLAERYGFRLAPLMSWGQPLSHGDN